MQHDKTLAQAGTVSRRSFIIATVSAAGGLLIGVIPSTSAFALGAELWSAEKAPAGEVNAFVVVEPDGSVLIRCPHAELGQGITTALPMIVAEELECDWAKVKVEYASGTRNLRENVYGNMWTVGSWAVYTSHQMLQLAGASARARLVGVAARRWGVPPTDCAVDKGTILHSASGRKLGYGEVANEAATFELAGEPTVKNPDRFRLIGKSVPRLDAPLKVDGSAKYAIDIRIPGMVYAAVTASPVFGAKLANVDASKIDGRRGIIKVVQLENAVAVVANSFWRAKEALALLKIEWAPSENGNTNSAELRKLYAGLLDQPATLARNDGNLDEGLHAAQTVIEATYETPYLAHATMEPLSATVDLKPDRLDVWIGTQGPMHAIKQAAAASSQAPEPPIAIEQAPGTGGLKPEQVFVHNCFLGGGFGRRYMHDEMRQAIIVAKAVGKPVKLVWTREEDMRQGRYRPQAAIRLRGGVTSGGELAGCEIKTATASILRAIGMNSQIKNDVDVLAVMGFTPTVYKIPNLRVSSSLRNTSIPVGVWRSVGLSSNTFALESFIDELAHASGQDPCAFRRRMLERPDFIALIDTLAEKSDWSKPLPKGRGRGMAISDRFNTIVGEVAEVTVDPQGVIQVDRVVAVVDPGHIVHPNAAEGQIEGGIIFGLSAALFSEITIKDGRVEQGNFDDYTVARLADTPKIEVYLTPSGGARRGGIGEAGTAPIAAAIGNAIFNATGKRLRQLPLKLV